MLPGESINFRGKLALTRMLSSEHPFSLGNPELEGPVGGRSHRAFSWQRCPEPLCPLGWGLAHA